MTKKVTAKIKFKDPILCLIYGYYHMDSSIYGHHENRTPFTEACEKIIDTYIGEVLGIDFKFFYRENEEIIKFNELSEIKSFCRNEFGNWFIGDALTDVVYEACYEKDLDQEKIEKELKRRYKLFMGLYNKEHIKTRIDELEIELQLLREKL